MLSIYLLAFILVPFAVIAVVLAFAVVFSRPEVPLKGDGQLERALVDDRPEPTAREIDGSRDLHTPRNQLIAVQPPVFATHSHRLGGGPY